MFNLFTALTSHLNQCLGIIIFKVYYWIGVPTSFHFQKLRKFPLFIYSSQTDTDTTYTHTRSELRLFCKRVNFAIVPYLIAANRVKNTLKCFFDITSSTYFNAYLCRKAHIHTHAHYILFTHQYTVHYARIETGKSLVNCAFFMLKVSLT